MNVNVGEEKMTRSEWENYHRIEMQFPYDVEVMGWLYGATYEEYCAEFDAQKAELPKMVDEVARVRTKLLTMPYGVEWEEEYNWYSDFHKDVYGYRPKERLTEMRGITHEMREAVWAKMDEARATAV